MGQREIKSIENAWVCVDPYGNADMGTVRPEEIKSKEACAVWAINWPQWEAIGWSCVNVSVAFIALDSTSINKESN